MGNFQVSIVKSSCVEDQVREAICLLGGMERFVKSGQRVLMKPNLTGPASYETGVTTNPSVLATLMELAWEAGARAVDVGDGTGSVHVGTLAVMKRCKISEIARKHGGNLLDLNKGPVKKLEVPDGKVLQQIRVNQAFLDYDVVVNIPVMKTHFITGVSLGMKNLKGCIPPAEKRRFHDIGVNLAVADMNQVLRTALTVVDGTVASEGLGPKEGKPVGFQVVLASENVLAADMVSAAVMGFAPEEIEHIRVASEYGIGPAGLEEIQILGEPVEKVCRSFQRAVPSIPPEEQAKIENYHACSGCLGCAAITVSRLSDMGFFKDHPDRKIHIVIGTKVEKKSYGKQTFFMGNCAERSCENGRFIRGCAPSALDAVNEILRYYKSDAHPDV